MRTLNEREGTLVSNRNIWSVKLELAEIKDKYAKLSADLADIKEVLGGFMAERSFIDWMSKAPCDEVNCLF